MDMYTDIYTGSEHHHSTEMDLLGFIPDILATIMANLSRNDVRASRPTCRAIAAITSGQSFQMLWEAVHAGSEERLAEHEINRLKRHFAAVDQEQLAVEQIMPYTFPRLLPGGHQTRTTGPLTLDKLRLHYANVDKFELDED